MNNDEIKSMTDSYSKEDKETIKKLSNLLNVGNLRNLEKNELDDLKNISSQLIAYPFKAVKRITVRYRLISLVNLIINEQNDKQNKTQ